MRGEETFRGDEMREGEMRLEIGFVRPVGCFICLLPCSELKEVDCDFRADGTCLGSGEDTFEFRMI